MDALVTGTFSSCAEIRWGLHQESMLGHLLFIINVNDLSGAVVNKLLVYSDNSAKLVADKNISTIETLLQK